MARVCRSVHWKEQNSTEGVSRGLQRAPLSLLLVSACCRGNYQGAGKESPKNLESTVSKIAFVPTI